MNEEAFGLPQARLKIVGMVLVGLFCIVGVRLSFVSLKAIPPEMRETYLPFRAEITDRHGIILASNLTLFSLYAHPLKIQKKPEVSQALHRLFPIIPARSFLDLLNSKKSFVWLLRYISPEKRLAIQALGIEGLGIMKDQKRIYPHDTLFCHSLGMTDIDQKGISGLEHAMNPRLVHDRTPLKTSLDARFQHLIHHELTQQIHDFQAEGGNALLADMQTGEILAMVSLPDFSPTALPNLKSKAGNALFNRNLSGVYEFGSIMKIHNTALTLEHGKATLKTVFDASVPLRIGRFRITDFRGQNRPLTVEEAFVYSSNIANAKMALSVGSKGQRAFFKKLGLLDPIGIELPERARPLMPIPWSNTQVITASYGYGFAITPLHVVQSVSILVLGHKIPLTLLARASSLPPKKSKPIISEKTSRDLIFLLRKAVLEGQAKNANASNCKIGAKTGTANSLSGGGYRQKENLTSCVSIFPIEQPRYILLVSIDKGKPNAKTHGYATAGWIAAPLISRIVEKLAPLLDNTMTNPYTHSLMYIP